MFVLTAGKIKLTHHFNILLYCYKIEERREDEEDEDLGRWGAIVDAGRANVESGKRLIDRTGKAMNANLQVDEKYIAELLCCYGYRGGGNHDIPITIICKQINTDRRRSFFEESLHIFKWSLLQVSEKITMSRQR